MVMDGLNKIIPAELRPVCLICKHSCVTGFRSKDSRVGGAHFTVHGDKYIGRLGPFSYDLNICENCFVTKIIPLCSIAPTVRYLEEPQHEKW